MLITRRKAASGAAVAAACLAGKGEAAPRPRPVPGPAQGPPLRFGALFPLTGEAALVGDESFRGVVLAANRLNADGGLLGRQVALQRADAPDAAHAAAEVQALAKDVAAIFGTGITSIALAASEAAGLAGVPYFELTATGAAVTGRSIPTIFRTCPEADAFGILSVTAVSEVLAPLWQRPARSLRLAVLAESGDLGQAVAASQAAECHRSGLQPAQTLSYAPGTVDFAPLVRPLKVEGIEVLLHTGAANDVVLLYRAMAEAGWRPRMVIGSGPAYAMTDTRQAVGTALDGTMAAAFPPYAVNPRTAPGAAAVEAAYRTLYGAEPRSGLSLAAYSGAGIFFAAMARAGAADGPKLRAAVLASHLPLGTAANGWGATFDASGQNQATYALLLQWQQGRPLAVYPEAAGVARPQTALAPLAPAHTP